VKGNDDWKIFTSLELAMREELKQLRDELKQLRDELKQLRDKEKQLRDELKQLRDEMARKEASLLPIGQTLGTCGMHIAAVRWR
jgi:septal ring factor EnvC (AmiA/AmiB activator)